MVQLAAAPDRRLARVATHIPLCDIASSLMKEPVVMSRILAFSGSSRTASYNKHMLDLLVAEAASEGADVTTVDLGELDMPIYNGDLEAAHGLPEGAQQLRGLLLDHQGLLIGCPEYNGFITPLLLNSIDWASRTGKGGVDITPWMNKTVAIASASPGPFGGMRSAGHLRTLLAGIGCLVLPFSLAVSNAADAFDESGNFKDERVRKRGQQLVERLVAVTEGLT